MAPEVLVQRFGVHDERGQLGGVAPNRLQHLVSDRLSAVPVLIEPVLQLCDLGADLHLDVQLDISRESWASEVARTHQRPSTDHIELGVGDVGLGMKL